MGSFELKFLHPNACQTASLHLCSCILGTIKCDVFQVDVVEDETNGKRTIKTTTICWGNKLSVLVSTPFHDPRLPANPNDLNLDFSQAQIELNTEADWQKVFSQHAHFTPVSTAFKLVTSRHTTALLSLQQ